MDMANWIISFYFFGRKPPPRDWTSRQLTAMGSALNISRPVGVVFFAPKLNSFPAANSSGSREVHG